MSNNVFALLIFAALLVLLAFFPVTGEPPPPAEPITELTFSAELEECLTKVEILTHMGARPCQVNADCGTKNYLGQCDSAESVCLPIVTEYGEKK